jgi:hypothetical protein
MALAPFFDRVWGALGGHLAVSRETLNTALDGVVIGIHCGKRLSENDRWIAELCVNLSARLYPRLIIAAPDNHCGALRELALAINPNIELLDSGGESATICIASAHAHEGIYPSARGWVAQVFHAPPVRGGIANPYAAGAAAALACAESFRRVFKKTPPEKDTSVSLLNYQTDGGSDVAIPKHNAGEVLVAGVGAIGNAGLWALSRDEKTTGGLFLVDPETVTLSNLQRYALATMADVGTSKVALARSNLRTSHWEVETRQMTLEQFQSEDREYPIPTTVVSVDNVDGRRSAQALLPRLAVSGWTGGDALGASWHVFARDAACLACLYHPHGKGMSAVEQAAKALGLSADRTALLWVTRQPLTELDIHTAALTLGVKDSVLMPWRKKSLGDLYTDVVCGAVPMDVTGVGRVEMVPLAHQSALAGLMMAAELVKRTDRKLSGLSQPEPLVSWDNIMQSVPEIWSKPRAREPGCICGDPDYQSVYRQRWGDSP